MREAVFFGEAPAFDDVLAAVAAFDLRRLSPSTPVTYRRSAPRDSAD